MLVFVTVSVVWFSGYPLIQCCAGPTLNNSYISRVSAGPTPKYTHIYLQCAGPNLNNSSQSSVSAGLNPNMYAHVCLVHGCLSITTVAEPISNTVNDLRAELKLSTVLQAYLTQVDENTNVSDTPLLAVLIHNCNSNFVTTEQLLVLIPMHKTATGEATSCGSDNLLIQYKLPLRTLTTAEESLKFILILIQGVTGGTDQTLGECSLC